MRFEKGTSGKQAVSRIEGPHDARISGSPRHVKRAIAPPASGDSSSR